MTRQLLIATSVALALSVTACGRNDDRADASRTAPGANTATTVPPSSPVDAGSSSSSASGGTSGMGAGGTASSPDTSVKGADSTTGMGTNPPVDTAAQPYGSQSSVPPSGTPSSNAGSTSR